jgi:hypothetical protein
MKKLLLIALLLEWPLLLFGQLSLVSAYRDERIGKDFNNNDFDWQRAFRPNFTQMLVSREGRLASSDSILPSHIPPTATGIQWLASPGLQIVGTNNQTSVSVRRVGGASTQEWVRASSGRSLTWPACLRESTWCGFGWPTKWPR